MVHATLVGRLLHLVSRTNLRRNLPATHQAHLVRLLSPDANQPIKKKRVFFFCFAFVLCVFALVRLISPGSNVSQ